ncbi:MAG TPA: YdeI/OmpD-associated family protein [Candidatus Angelobacter sp.]|nr:YdeI/OmpD-associated family protein [Candidatus Angelobacter sp.]
MPAKSAARTFQATLEHSGNSLNWIIARVPFDVFKQWGTRGHLRVQGEINGSAFRTTLFPTGKGDHFFIVNKKMQFAGKVAPGLTARFRIEPDVTKRKPVAPPQELLDALGQSKRLLKIYESFNPSFRKYMVAWVAEGKQESTRRRRADQLAERLMETLEAERELPPMLQLAFRQNPLAREAWERLSPSHRRRHLFSIFYYRRPEARARRLAKCFDEILNPGKRGKDRLNESQEWD